MEVGNEQKAWKFDERRKTQEEGKDVSKRMGEGDKD